MNYQKQRINDDWSGRHVRLRFEMLMSALVFYLVARYGAEKLSLPLIKFEKPVDEILIIFGSFVFSLFTFSSFLLRSIYEVNFWAKKELSSFTEIRRFSRRLKLIEDKVVLLGNLPSFEINDDELASNHLKVTKDSVGTINRFISELSGLHEENGVVSPVHPKFWARLVLGFAQVNSSANKILKYVDRANDNLGSGRINEYMLGGSNDQISAEGRFLVNLYKEIEPEIKQRIRRLYLNSFVNWVQTYLFSVFFPSIVAGALILIGYSYI